MLALGSARLSTEKDHWTGLQRERGREKEEGVISHLGKTTKSYKGIILSRPETREDKPVPGSADGNK